MLKFMLIALLSISALQAKNLTQAEKNLKNSRWYTSYTVGQSFAESGDKILGEEPLSNVVGGDSVRQELQVGLMFLKGGDRKRAAAFLYAWLNDNEKYYERGIGAGIIWETAHISRRFPIRFSFSGQAGIGVQDNKGESFHTDTDVNTVSYVTSGSVGHAGYTAKFTEDTNVVEMDLGIGMTYDFTKQLSAGVEYKYIHKYYDLEYIVNGASVGTSISGIVQSNHNLGLKISYIF